MRLFGLATTVGGCVLLACSSGGESGESDTDSHDSAATGGADGGADGAANKGDGPVLVCGDVPAGEVGADYAHLFEVEGGVPPYTFDSGALPAGLTLDDETGALVGTPAQHGEFVVGFAVADMTGAASATSCTLQIKDPFIIDMSRHEAPCIRVAVDNLADFVTPSLDPMTCAVATGPGNGAVPVGLEVGQDCELSGSIAEGTRGAYAWIVRVERAGVARSVPFCAAATAGKASYEISVDPGDGSNSMLTPWGGEFVAGSATSAGGEFPSISVSDATTCADGPCFFSVSFGLERSLFDSATLDPSPEAVPQGLVHSLSISGPPVPAAFEARAWVQNLAFEYCLAPQQGICTPSTAVDGFHYAIVMLPQLVP